MSNDMFKVPEEFRVKEGDLSTTERDGNNGAFLIPSYVIKSPRAASIIASDGLGWEHVSVKMMWREGRFATPNWEEMCRVKDIFWGEEDEVIQFHPKKSEYVNMHPNVLHLWRPTEGGFPTPDKLMV
jgi:hypothetical protein